MLVLLFYLAWHHFSVDTTNVDACIQAGLVMCINNVAAKCFVNTSTTVVRSLGARVTTDRPAKWPFNIFLQQRVFLLKAIPGFFFISDFSLIKIAKSL